MQNFFENESAQIYFDATLDTLFLEYTNKVINHEQFVTINTAVLNTFVKLQTVKFVADIRKMGVIGIESQKWIVDNFLPGIIKHLNGKKPVVIQLMDASEIFAKLAGNKIKENSQNAIPDFQVIQFTDRAKMETYLRSV
jgi:hypothetical protein